MVIEISQTLWVRCLICADPRVFASWKLPRMTYIFETQSIMWLNTLSPRQNGRHFADDILKCIFLNEYVWIPIEISLKFVPKGPIDNIPALVQIMAWRHPGDKPLSEPMMVRLPMHIFINRPQWVNRIRLRFTDLLHLHWHVLLKQCKLIL